MCVACGVVLRGMSTADGGGVVRWGLGSVSSLGAAAELLMSDAVHSYKVYGAAAARRSPESDHFGGRPSRPAYPAASVCIHLHEVGSAADGVGSPRHGDADVAELDVLYAVFRELQHTKRIGAHHP